MVHDIADVVSYFGEVRKAVQALDRQEELVKRLRDACHVGGPSMDRVGSAVRNPNGTEGRLIRLIDAERNLERDRARVAEMSGAAEMLIAEIDNAVHRDVLKYRYLHALRWEEIEEIMHYSNRWVYKLHAAALVSAQAALDEGRACAV